MNVVIRTCFDQDESVWAQREALSLLATLTPQDAISVCTKRILRHETAPPEDIFVRSHAVGLLRDLATERERLEILERVIRGRDPSELVRMEVVRVLAASASLESDRVLLTLLRGGPSDRDPSPRVRAEAALQVRLKANRGPQHEEIAARALAWVIRNDPNILTRRVAMEEAEQLAKDRQERQRRYRVDETDHLLLEALDEVVRRDPDVRLKRIATEIRESIVVRTLAAYDWVETRIKRPLSAIDEYSTLRVPAREVAVPETLLGRILAHFTRRDFGVTLERTRTAYLLRKGDRFRRKLWRVLHEMRNPDAAKRSAHQHTKGRSLRGHLRVPPGQLAELVETKVPGERLYLPHEQSWRRFLPTVDDYMSTFSWLPWRREHVVRVFSSEGVTEIRDPRSWFRAAKEHLRMSWAYRELVQLRNREGKREGERARYVAELRYQYGLLTSFAPATYQFAGKTYPLLDPTLNEHFKSAVTFTMEGEVDPFNPNTASVSAPLDADFAPFDEDVRDPEATEDGEGEERDDSREGVDELLRPLQPAGVLDRPNPEGPADLDTSNENLFSGSFASGAETDLLGIGPDISPGDSDSDRTGSFGSPPLRVTAAGSETVTKGPDPDETLVGGQEHLPPDAPPPDVGDWGDETSEMTASVAVWRPMSDGSSEPVHDLQSNKTGAMDLTASDAVIDDQLAATSDES
ncbi:MAG: HEAT repeat domain-containing protein, partial [Planctomycetota bacterium]